MPGPTDGMENPGPFGAVPLPMPGPTDGMENPGPFGAVPLPIPGPTDGMENPGPFGAVPTGAEPPSFTLLGPVRAWRNGRQVALGTPQQRAVLAILLLRDGAVVPVDDLVRAIWAERAPRGAAGTVRTYVSRLRRVLGSLDIANVAGGYVLRVRPQDVDVNVFRELVARSRERRQAGQRAAALAHLRSAQRLWSGPPLAGMTGEFARAQRSALEQLKYAADLERTELELELEPGSVDADRLSALVAAQPLHERPRELLIRALAATGRRAEALAAFEAGRDLLADRLGVDPGPGLLRAYRRVLAGETTPGAGSSTVAAVSYPVPAQLPPDLADFTGRSAVLRILTESVSRSAAAVVGIVGAPGMGASAVAVHAAHRLRAAYPDGQLYADLRAAGPDQVDAALANFLRAYGVTRLPPGRSERVELWRRCLAGRRVLVLLDHGSDVALLGPLLPAVRGSLALVTGRHRRADIGDVRWLELAPFSDEDGLALLERIVGTRRIRAEPAAARRVVASCAGRPLRLRMAAERIASRPNWTVEMMASTWRQPEVGTDGA